MMKEILRICLAALLTAAVAVACSKDDKDGSVAYAQKALFLKRGETATVVFSGVNIASYSVSSVPTGWEKPELNPAAEPMTMTVKAPAADDTEAKSTGSIVLRGMTYGGEAVSASLFVSLDTPVIDQSDAPANCYIANRPNAQYLFDATRKGDGSKVATARVAVIWQTSMNLLRYLALDNGKVSFFVVEDSDDETIVKRGNALIGAYDDQDNLLWSWHVWITDYDPEADALDYGDYRVMSRQLGALQNGNADKDEIWNSYGLYYQWGRKDPFVGPSDWLASRGTSLSLYDGDSNTVRIGMVALSAETGTFAYTDAHPLHFLTTKAGDAAWLKDADAVNGQANGWKAVNNPCPSGWEVAPAAAFADLRIADDLTAEAESYEKKYGWTLTTGVSPSFYFAAGRRIYADGTIQNLFDESLPVRSVADEAQPWVGYNWATDEAGAATVFCYWFKKSDPKQSGLRTDLKLTPANGLSVRCVKKR